MCTYGSDKNYATAILGKKRKMQYNENMRKFDHLLHILYKKFAVCVSLWKFCSQFALFAQNFTQLTKKLCDRGSHQSR